MGRPEFLKRITELLRLTKERFRDVSRSGTAEENKETPEDGPLGTYRNLFVSKSQLVEFLKKGGLENAETEVDTVWDDIDTSKDGLVSFEEWMTYMHPANPLGRRILLAENDFSDREVEELSKRYLLLIVCLFLHVFFFSFRCHDEESG